MFNNVFLDSASEYTVLGLINFRENLFMKSYRVIGLAFQFELGGVGIWLGLAAGLGIVSVLMTLRWRRHLAHISAHPA